MRKVSYKCLNKDAFYAYNNIKFITILTIQFLAGKRSLIKTEKND